MTYLLNFQSCVSNENYLLLLLPKLRPHYYDYYTGLS